MAVYTEVSDDQLTAFAAAYDFGAILGCKGIAEGVENSNYLLETSQGPLILTLYEKRVAPADLPFFLALMEHLARAGVPCPVPLKGRDGKALRTLSGRPAAVITFLRGMWPRRISPEHCGQLGGALASLHAAGRDFSMSRPNNLSVSGWHDLYARCGDAADTLEPDLGTKLRRELDAIAAAWPKPGDDLPVSVIHADLFPDNVFFLDGKCSGLIDFYFACTDFLAYDLAVCLNAWCFEPDGAFNITKANRLFASYQSIRPLTAAERRALPVLARGAAMRFLLTRLYDWVNTPPGAMVRPKDPREYLQKLNFHGRVASIAEYGLNGWLEEMTSADDTVELFTDGACLGNPGPGGWAALLRYRGNEREVAGGETATTNNRMELVAVIEGLRTLTRPCRVTVMTDSQYVQKGISEWIIGWKKRAWRTADKKPVKNADLWQALDEARTPHDVTWLWVRGHSGHPENERVDVLARTEAERFRERV